MKVIVLGSGSAYGVPVIGGDWGDCHPGNPRNRRLCPSILIEEGDTRVLVDMGPDFREQAARHNIRTLDGVFFTHPHADHISGMMHLPMLMRYYQDRNLPLYAERATRREIEKNWWYMFDPAINVEYSGSGRPFWHEVVYGSKLEVGNLKVQTFKQFHGRMNSLGLRVGDFAYSTDVNDMPEESFAHLHGLDVWILECNCLEETKMHMNLDKVLGWVERFKPKKTWLTHLDHTMDYDRISDMLPKGIELAYDNLEIDL